MGQFTEQFKKYKRQDGVKAHEATLIAEAIKEFESRWKRPAERLKIIPGKQAFTHLNTVLQDRYKVSVTPLGTVEVMRADEVPASMVQLISSVEAFALKAPPA